MKSICCAGLLILAGAPQAHQQESPPVTTPDGVVTYLGNTGLLVDQGDQQILFDPFFHSHFGQYQLVPDDIRQAIFNSDPPFDSIEMILISHAHGDHFDAKDVVDYLLGHKQTQLVAPMQAVELLKSIDGFAVIKDRVKGIELAFGDAPIELNYDHITIGVVRIPHAGWPGRADVANLVYRVTLENLATVMHMGDADPNDEHFKPWISHWEAQVTDAAFPPYWFMLTPAGQDILAHRINAIQVTGVHVPAVVPESLQSSGAEYFSETGKTQLIINKNIKTENQ